MTEETDFGMLTILLSQGEKSNSITTKLAAVTFIVFDSALRLANRSDVGLL